MNRVVDHLHFIFIFASSAIVTYLWIRFFFELKRYCTYSIYHFGFLLFLREITTFKRILTVPLCCSTSCGMCSWMHNSPSIVSVCNIFLYICRMIAWKYVVCKGMHCMWYISIVSAHTHTLSLSVFHGCFHLDSILFI